MSENETTSPWQAWLGGLKSRFVIVLTGTIASAIALVLVGNYNLNKSPFRWLFGFDPGQHQTPRDPPEQESQKARKPDFPNPKRTQDVLGEVTNQIRSLSNDDSAKIESND